MRHRELISVIEATHSYESLARHALMDRRGRLSKSQMDILLALKFSGPASMTELSRKLAISKEQATRAMNPLVEMGFVDRRRNEGNRRMVTATLTKKAESFLEEDLECVLKELDETLSSLSPEERADLVDASQRATRILKRFRGIG